MAESEQKGDVQLGCDKCGQLKRVLIRCKNYHLICQSCWDAAGKKCPMCGSKEKD